MPASSDAHVHTRWCDGYDTAGDMAERAIKLGFSDLGFSSHAAGTLDAGYVGLSEPEAYRAEIAAVRERYAGRLTVLCGLEQDYFAPADSDEYDYIIHSTHYLPLGENGYEAVDDSPEIIESALRIRYGGDGAAMVKDYYEFAAKGVMRYSPDIVGHYDLITKFNAGGRMFDEDSAGYRDSALLYLDAVIEHIGGYGGMIEINAGGMRVNGRARRPYAGAPFILERLRDKKARVIITGDSHSADHLGMGYDDVYNMLRDAGFSSMAVLRGGEFRDVRI